MKEPEEVPTPKHFIMGDASEEVLQVEVLPGKVMGQADWNEDEQVAKARQCARILKDLKDL